VRTLAEKRIRGYNDSRGIWHWLLLGCLIKLKQSKKILRMEWHVRWHEQDGKRHSNSISGLSCHLFSRSIF
jgi:hypothetical protein